MPESIFLVTIGKIHYFLKNTELEVSCKDIGLGAGICIDCSKKIQQKGRLTVSRNAGTCFRRK